MTRLAFFFLNSQLENNFHMTASKHCAPPIHIYKASKNDPEEKPEQSGLDYFKNEGGKRLP